MDSLEVKGLVEYLVANGVTRFKSKDIELELTPKARRPQKKDKAKTPAEPVVRDAIELAVEMANTRRD